MTNVHAFPSSPALVLSETDAERLSALALRAIDAQPVVAGLLLAEIERAEVRPDPQTPDKAVGMGATVQFLDEVSGRRRTVELVYPQDADIAADRISVLTPIGAGLIGLSEGQTIAWPDRDGHTRLLRILEVRRAAA
ncbi:nucleoside diphosphate kinase regulator [Caulobacter sp. CCUG 60055]|uniref:nucleoside diphosphate kinase regulator n=1 Tax=Caulobacter sp. CCUG 60055 TaxID=2100090 RepID=UPI001FA72940|nr:nucleoside diphosphate kinase regulator [Caulobacter sp. CCUG 60055]MBQ1543287.1 nucleoside diphosphate kinase regulator [Caulobacteraceae bacterium]MCI3179815.1 nucleoside diphosphate kinase regulator [Caulobacter sp. CCUG 60055]